MGTTCVGTRDNKESIIPIPFQLVQSSNWQDICSKWTYMYNFPRVLRWAQFYYKPSKRVKNRHLPCKARSIFVLVFVSQPTCGLYVEVSVQLINEHKVDVELLTVKLQAQISKPLHLQQGALQGVNSWNLQMITYKLITYYP